MNEFKNYNFEDFILDDSFWNYVKGINEVDIKYWENWMNQNHKNKQIALKAKTSLKHINFKKENLPIEFINNEWKRLNNRFNFPENETSQISKSKKLAKIWYSAATIAVFISILSALIFTKSFNNRNKNLTFTEIVAPFGQIKNILLPDNTLVYLNVGTKLSYNENYGQSKREVFLEGEAYFDVMHDENKPFIIQTCENKITVLGTVFNVSAYLNENIHQTSLVRGKINIEQNDGKKFLMTPNQNYLLIRNKNESKIYTVENIDKFSSWKDGELIFQNLSFSDIAHRLERTHNVKFMQYNKNVMNLRYTGKFSINDKISKILDIIKLTTPFEYKIKNDTVMIR